MLFLHETHSVIGAREDEFDAALRDEWMPAVAKSGGARLLYMRCATRTAAAPRTASSR